MLWLRALRLLLIRPHRSATYPSAHPDFGCESYDILAVLLNQKPAAITADTPAVRSMLEHNRTHHVRRGYRASSPFIIISNNEDTANELERLFSDRSWQPDERGFEHDPEWHRRVGQLLGYREAGIERFVRGMQRSVPQER